MKSNGSWKHWFVDVHQAVVQDDADAIVWMLRHELVDLTATDDLGNTAAHLAVFHDSPRLVPGGERIGVKNKLYFIKLKLIIACLFPARTCWRRVYPATWEMFDYVEGTKELHPPPTLTILAYTFDHIT